jgi:PAS domain S-box-containing protein
VRTAVDAFPHCAWVADACGQALYFNQRAVELTGLSLDHLLGSGWTDAIHPLDADAVYDAWGRAVRRGQPFEAEYRVRDKDGCYQLVVGRAVAMDATEHTRFWIGTLSLATEGPTVIRLPELVAGDVAGTDWSDAVRVALARDELICTAQPIIPLSGGRRSEELLVRMSSATGGEILPTAFLPSIEASGVVIDVDRWMLHRAIERAADGVRVHVNISARSLDDPELLELIPRLLVDQAVSAENLIFELTETCSIRDHDRAVGFAEMLAELGCGLALDDFGSGYAGFAQLAAMPITHLKISHEFVGDMRANSCHQHIVDIVVDLAERFRCETVAEGVEDEATLRLLRRRGVDYVQGFHLGRPRRVLPPARRD